jgi:hypothetical protein
VRGNNGKEETCANSLNEVLLSGTYPLTYSTCTFLSDFSIAERMGWQSLWDNKRTGHWSTRRRHDDVMKLIGACIKKTAGVTKACVFEKDAEFARSCYRSGGKVHRPDMAVDNLFDDNIKYVFDLTNASAFFYFLGFF